jgi:hypothetical protein
MVQTLETGWDVIRDSLERVAVAWNREV